MAAIDDGVQTTVPMLHPSDGDGGPAHSPPVSAPAPHQQPFFPPLVGGHHPVSPQQPGSPVGVSGSTMTVGMPPTGIFMPAPFQPATEGADGGDQSVSMGGFDYFANTVGGETAERKVRY